MWWISRNGVLSGPFPRDQIEKRIKLGLIVSLDRVSEDKRNWTYIRDSEFWHQERTIPENLPPPSPVGGRKIGLASRRAPTPTVAAPIITSAPVADVAPPQEPAHYPCGTNGVNQINSHKGRGVLMIIAASVVGAIIVAGAVILAFTLLKKSNETSARSVGTSKSSFQAAQDKLVIIECGGGSGSGFLAKMDGKVYLVSNEHVLRGAGAPKATLLNGEILTLGAFSVAEDRDLARFEIPGATKGFEISTADPSEGEQCTIYGDTGGVGVMGSSQGVILARGDKFVETDAGIAHGASGGPALNAKGFVFGAVDWGGDFTGTDPHAKGTRYDGMRRFLVRLDRTVKWKTINRDEYEYQAYVFDSVDLFLQKLMPFLIFDDPQNPSEDIPTFSELDAKMFAPDKFGFAENLLALSTACEKFSISFMKYFQLNERWKALNERLVSQHADDETCKKATENFIAENNPDAIWAKVITDLRSLTTKRRQVLGVGRTVLAETRWDSPQYMHGHTVDDNQHMGGSITHFRQLIGYYDEVMQQRMRDWEKKFKFEEGRYDDED